VIYQRMRQSYGGGGAIRANTATAGLSRRFDYDDARSIRQTLVAERRSTGSGVPGMQAAPRRRDH
jgi:hypothetical protein